MKRLRIFSFILMILIISLVICACEHKETADSVFMNIDYRKNSDGSTDEIKNGREQYFFTVGDGEAYDIEMKFETKSGTINASITKDKDKDNAIYTGKDIQNCSFTVTAYEPGEYRILYEAKDYIGEYSYTISKK